MRGFVIRQIAACAMVFWFGFPVAARSECPLISVSEGMAYATTVAAFSGTVNKVEEVNGRGHMVTFDVQRVWKGTVTKRVSLYQSNSSESIQFLQGVQYVILAFRPTEAGREQIGTPPNVLAIMTCASRLLEEAEGRGYLREIGPGRLLR